MADTLTLESAGRVRQKAYNAVYSQGTKAALDGVVRAPASPYHFYALKAFFLHWAANKGNLDLQYIPYTSEQIATGTTGLDTDIGPNTIYVWFGKARRTTATTKSFIDLHDADTDGATTTTIATQMINATGQTWMTVWPDGIVIADDLAIASADAVGGSTETTVALGADGFVIVGT